MAKPSETRTLPYLLYTSAFRSLSNMLDMPVFA